MTENNMAAKIAALLAKADSTDSEPEAAAFYAKAQELMLRYSIDAQALREAQGRRGASEKPVLVKFEYSSNDSNAFGKRHLMNQAAKASGVRMVNEANSRYSNVGRPGNSGVASQWCSLVGFKEDIELAKILYVNLLVQGARFGSTDFKGLGMRSGKSRFMTGYLVGFATRVGQRLAESKIQVESTGMALIVRRDDEVKDAVNELIGRTKAGHSSRVDAMGNRLGRQAGDRADIGNARVGMGSAQLTGGR